MSAIEDRLTLLREQLTDVRTAISAILGGAQEYRVGSRSIKRADLGLLYQEQRRLESEIQALESGGGIFRLVQFEGR
ncbi:peptidylprolyl isomerase [Paenibacillus sp. 2TAB19]|uniref:peptidylprolyl isomerase n=1 Tax=Paenibacillus sp. 2TAB19 TaxID=3233003 RepID=UPI003F94C759